VFSNTIQPPAGTEIINLVANYLVEYNNNPALNSSVLYSQTLHTGATGTITLNAFDHRSTRLTFTGLEPGDEVNFREYDYSLHPWCITSLVNYSVAYITIPTLIAGADGTVEVYVDIFAENANCNFRINGQPSAADAWYSFSSGSYPEGRNSFYGQHFIINCSGL